MSWGSPGECPRCPGAVPCRGDLSLQPQPRCGAASRASALGTRGRIHPAKFRFPPGQWLYRGQTDYREQGETRSLRAPTPGCPWGQRGLGWPGGCGMAWGCQGKFTSSAQASAPCLGHVQLGPGQLPPAFLASDRRRFQGEDVVSASSSSSYRGSVNNWDRDRDSGPTFNPRQNFPRQEFSLACCLSFPQLESRADSSMSLGKCLGSPQEDFLADPPLPPKLPASSAVKIPGKEVK